VTTWEVAADPARATTATEFELPHLGRRVLRKPAAAVCLAYLIVVVAIAVIAPLVMPHVANERAGDLIDARQGPSWTHLLGTDSLGRDVLDRLLVGAQPTLLGVAEMVLVVLAIGVTVGLAAGFFGGAVDRAVSWLTDLTLSLPVMALALVVLSIFHGSMFAAMVTVGVLAAFPLARIVRSATLPIREELYIAAAEVSGLSRSYIISRHVLPRVAGVVIVLGALSAATALIAQTGLAYLGLINLAPAPSWGGMVADGTQAIVLQPWLIWPPGIAIVLTILAFGVLGDAIRDAATETWSTQYVKQPTRERRRSPVPVAVRASGRLLCVERLTVAFPGPHGPRTVIEDVSFDIRPGEAVGLVGESGCGKTITAMAILGLAPGDAETVSGRVALDGVDLAVMRDSELRRIRGRTIGLVSQEPMVSLNPAFRVGWQLAHSVRIHHGVSRREARARALDLLARVHLPSPEDVVRRYPHELSGGMAQRVAIARALAGEPKLLIADEPTTALDVTVQAEILELLRQLQRERGMAILLVTHDWGVVADVCQRAVVMYAGQVVERAAVADLFEQPLHPYTQALLAANPHHAPDADRLPTIPGLVPRPGQWPGGCHFHPRCSYALAACENGPIPLAAPVRGRETRCIRYRELIEG
jgi:peptide/nickel transport system permease protein